MAGLSTVGVPEVMPEAGAARPQSTSATAAAFGGGTANALEGVGQAALKIGDFFGEVAVDDQTNQLFERWNKRLRGDPNKMVPGPDGTPMPDTGYMGLKGRNALDARKDFETGLDQDLKEVRSGLMSPKQQAKFDDQTRRYRQHVQTLAGSHADTQAGAYATNVNKASSVIALTHVANNADDMTQVLSGIADLTAARVKEAQLAGGGPELITAAKESAIRDGTKTWLQAVSTTQPKRALQLLEKNKNALGTQYDELHREFRTRADTQGGNEAGERAVLSTYQTQAPAQTVIPVLTQAADRNGVSATYLMRTWQIESGGSVNPPDSSTGAAGPFQFVSSTARQYGLANPRDFGQSAEAAARLAADNKAQMSATLGRPPTDAELYLAHQQGAGGAGKLLANPTIRAGDLVGDRAIRVNGGDPNAPAANFTSMWAAKFNGAGALASNLAARKQQAFQSIEEDPALTDGERQRARMYVTQQIQAMSIAEGASAAAKKDANDQAANGYVQQMFGGNVAGLYDKINSDPALDWHSRTALMGMLEKHAGDDTRGAAQTYGPGFWQAWKNIGAPVDDPARITDVTQLMQMAGGDKPTLTVAGVEKLTTWMGQIKKSPDQQAVHNSMTALTNYAKGKLSFAQDLGPVKIPDPKGEAIFNGEFIPKFQAAYAEWVKAGKNPWEFLTRENVDKMVHGMRDRSKMEADRLAAAGEVVAEDPKAPPPPAPKGVDTKAWGKVMALPLTTADGKPYPRKVLADRLNMLISEPTPEKIAQYDSSQFGKKLGVDGKTLLEQLGVLKAPPPAPLPPGANAPHNLLRRAIGLPPTEAKP